VAPPGGGTPAGTRRNHVNGSRTQTGQPCPDDGSPPDSSEGGPGKDRPNIADTTAKQGHPQGNAHPRPLRAATPAPWKVYPAVHVVTARSGRQRLLLLVRCGHCQDIHQHTAPLEFTVGRRKSACGAGVYVLLVKAKARAAA
jgi:hypothetical protein